MGIFDLSPEKLHTYQNSSPCPADFDAYWDRALKELDRQPMDYTLEPPEFSAPGAECFHLWFTGVGGARIHAQLVRPEKKGRKGPGLVMFHGYQGNAGDWTEKLLYAYSGFTVAALDARGQNGLSEDNLTVSGNTVRGQVIRGADDPDPDKLYYRNVYLDTVQLTRILMSMDTVDETRIGATGLSQGGGLTLACAALEPRVRAIVPAAPFLSDFKRVYELDLAMHDTHGAYDEFGQRFFCYDPFHEKADAFWERLGYIDVANLAPRIRAKTLLFTGLMDTICPPSTQFAAYNRITAPKDVLLAPDFGHEYIWGFHDRRFEFFQRELNQK